MKIYEKIHLFVQRNNNSTEIKFDLVVKMIQVHRIDNMHREISFPLSLKAGTKAGLLLDADIHIGQAVDKRASPCSPLPPISP